MRATLLSPTAFASSNCALRYSHLINESPWVAVLAFARYGADVMLAGTAIEARRSGVKGIHSAASSLRQTYQRPQVGLWGVSCHGQDDVAAAVELDADFAVLSPVLPSARHPDVPPLGWETFRQIAIEAPIPVYAQGGLAPRHVAEARAAGAVGVALSLDTVPGGGDER